MDLTPLGYAGYEIEADGSVWSTLWPTRRRLKPTPNINTGILMVAMQTEDGPRNRSVAKVALTAFRGPPPSDREREVRHLDGDRANCSIANLTWGPRTPRGGRREAGIAGSPPYRVTCDHPQSSYGVPVILDGLGNPLDYTEGVRAAKDWLGLGNRELGVACGVSERTVEGWLNGRMPTIAALNMLGLLLSRHV